jgi:hypothetical protein
MGVNPKDEASDVTVTFADAAARVSGLEIWSIVRLQRQSWSDPERLDPLGFAKWNLKAAGMPRTTSQPQQGRTTAHLHLPACGVYAVRMQGHPSSVPVDTGSTATETFLLSMQAQGQGWMECASGLGHRRCRPS